MGGWKPFDHLCMFGQELDTKVAHRSETRTKLSDTRTPCGVYGERDGGLRKGNHETSEHEYRTRSKRCSAGTACCEGAVAGFSSHRNLTELEERDSCQVPSHQKYETSKHDVRAIAEVEEEEEPDAGHAAFRRRRGETGSAASCAN